jgi:hypothetical protein
MNAPLLGLFFVTDRFSPNGHLLRRDPDFDTALLEASNIKADQERIIGTAQTEAQFASYFRLRLSPTFEFMPAHAAAPFKDLVGATADGLLDSAGLLHPTDRKDSDSSGRWSLLNYIHRKLLESHLTGPELLLPAALRAPNARDKSGIARSNILRTLL